jgi:uncharacterized protein YaiE (UPF0345 family)
MKPRQNWMRFKRLIINQSEKEVCMSKTLEGVSIVKAANVYFDGKVTSRSMVMEDGSKVSLGIMAAGDYEFGTADKEIMEILSGELEVLLKGSEQWLSITGGQSLKCLLNPRFS